MVSNLKFYFGLGIQMGKMMHIFCPDWLPLRGRRNGVGESGQEQLVTSIQLCLLCKTCYVIGLLRRKVVRCLLH